MTTALTADRTNEVLAFWFIEHGPKDWFGKNEAFDETIHLRFHHVYEQLADEQIPGFNNADSCLAAILVLDQFPRNLFRGSPQAFATDDKAIGLARNAVDSELDKPLSLEQRVFMYMPFEHSEDLMDQERSCALFAELGNDYYLDYAERHREVIRRFGRFPHRNAILGRANTAAETEYLASPNAGF